MSDLSLKQQLLALRLQRAELQDRIGLAALVGNEAEYDRLRTEWFGVQERMYSIYGLYRRLQNSLTQTAKNPYAR